MSAKEQPRRLGRGLAALLGDAAVPASISAPGVQALPVDVMGPSPFQPRRAMDQDLLQELANSIAQRGILQPLLVRPTPGVAGSYQIIAGERRWRAAQLARLHEVPVLVRQMTDADAMAAGLVENLQRADLNAMEEAAGYQRLLDEFKMTQEQLAEAIGKTRSHITHCLRVLNLPAEVQELVRSGDLSASHARALVNHDHPLAAARAIVKDGLTVKQIQDQVVRQGRTFPDGPPKPGPKVDPDTEALAGSLSERLGVRVKVTFDGKGGALIINYKSLDQLDEVLAKLMDQ
jgi:ParB family chromosome partitioning protein